MHRFVRPLGIPYANLWEDRVRNYWIGFLELGWDTAPIAEHFEAFVGGGVGAAIVAKVAREFAPAALPPEPTTPEVDGAIEIDAIARRRAADAVKVST